ncbi:OmpA/MotB family protein [Tunturiibacter gelidoferens]|uniref:Flagellar motor protein MotB n=1 Tax=Tunturiibacter lichenicola TaxID=2051959 RepID=A0A7Y9NQX7_9BACT|nr:OmpA family protein [Edaphobacter lichenicola]NYF53911.1 flagellar motor protein MotB [Edaphobacter lichenicola]
MRSREKHDHLSSSFTDLMSSLVVIFILLFLAFVHEQEGRQESIKDKLLAELQQQLKEANLDQQNIKKDGDAVVIIVPEGLMNFETGKSDLKEGGKAFLQKYIPPISKMLVNDFQNDVDSLIVEGYTDRQRAAGSSEEQGEAQNLVLSQERSMKVVEESLNDLTGHDKVREREFFLDRLSASGRGEQQAIHEAGPENNPNLRRVIFRIRVRSTALQDAAQEIKADLHK